ncbi:hypothetical protein NE237_020643 [Protea cynaroides]|uniref:PGG domain-containing protein n=1 Tax=Protea cynaroides TaxID=273540 RepID=A0A9Q0H713_9MAGN|nr:hypothetical protein NE237_020643 [Protea cynaroides]
MDQNLYTLMEAAKTGDEESLYELLSRDSSILDKADQQFRDNPLHVAVSNDQTLFAAEIANLKPSLARRLNQHGLSPLHIAAENGQVGMVKKLLKLDKELCLIKGRNGMVPLHCAAKSANPQSQEVIKELLSACPKCITALTTRNETALHTAVKSGSSKNFEALVKWIKKQSGYNILRWKDQEGNTILHLATSERKPENLQIVKLLLCDYGYFVRKAAKINTINNSEETAFDVFNRANGYQIHPDKEDGEVRVVTDKIQGDEKEIEKNMRKILRSKGAKSTKDFCCTLIKKKGSKQKRVLDSGIKWLLKVPNFLSFKVDKDTSSDVRNALLVIFILIVTATYTTGINPPGGLWQDDSNPSNDGSNNSNNSSALVQRAHIAGRSIWFDHNPDSFRILMLCNYAGFLVSVVLVFNLTEGYPLRGPILVALFLMLITYGLSIRLLFLGLGPLTVLFHGMILTIPLPVALVLLVATANWIWEIKE